MESSEQRPKASAMASAHPFGNDPAKIERYRAFWNRDPVEGMIQYCRMVQDANRPLLIRGSLTLDEARLIVDSLDPRGLYLHILPESREQVDTLRPILGM